MQSFEEVIRDLVGDEPTVARLVELLGRKGFLVSTVQTGFTDRQVRVHLIGMLGRMADPAALDALEREARRAAPVLGGELVADAARHAIAAIHEAAGQQAQPAATPSMPSLQQAVQSALDLFRTPVTDPADLEAAGLCGGALQHALGSLEPQSSLPEPKEASLEDAAAQVIALLRAIGTDADIVAQVEAGFAQPDDVDAWFDVSILLRSAGVFHGALETYDVAVGRFPPEVDAMWWSNRGFLLFHWERFAEAADSCRRALAINPEYARAQQGLADAERCMAARDQSSDQELVAPLAYAPRRLIRKAGQGTQTAPQSYALLSPANLAVLESPGGSTIEDAAAEVLAADLEPEGDDPVIFISYRWESTPHRKWVFRFAGDLERRGYRVIFDQYEGLDLRDHLRSAGLGVGFLRVDRMGREVPQLVQQLGRSHVFMAVLTERYRRCVDPPRTGATTPEQLLDAMQWPQLSADDGWVFDEWQLALRLRLAGRMRWTGIWRGGPVVPPPFTRDTVVDLRDDAKYEAQLDAHFPRRSGPSGG